MKSAEACAWLHVVWLLGVFCLFHWSHEVFGTIGFILFCYLPMPEVTNMPAEKWGYLVCTKCQRKNHMTESTYNDIKPVGCPCGGQFVPPSPPPAPAK